MRTSSWLAFVLSVSGAGLAAAQPAPGPLPPGDGALLVRAGLELRGGPPEPPARRVPPPRPAVAAPLPPPPSPLEQAVERAVRQRLAGGARGGLAVAVTDGLPPSPRAQAALHAIASSAGLSPGDLASVADTPRDQARFLVEKLFDPRVGEQRVTILYGMPGQIAADSARRLRDIFQQLDLSAGQKETIVDVVEAALVDLGATGQVEEPGVEWVDVDPGPRADRGRFEQAVAASPAIARCLRPDAGDGGRFYQLTLPRAGAGEGGAACVSPWSPAPPPAAVATTGSGFGNSGGSGAPGAAVEPAAPPVGTGSTGPGRYVVTDGPSGPQVVRQPGD